MASSSLLIAEGSVVSFGCEVMSEPLSRLQWAFKGAEYLQGPEVDVSESTNQRRSESLLLQGLTIPGVRVIPSHSGAWECIARQQNRYTAAPISIADRQSIQLEVTGKIVALIQLRSH